MKVAIEILSTQTNPSTRNIEAIKNTYISLANKLMKEGSLKHSYDFYFYYGGYDASTLGTAVTIKKDLDYDNTFIVNTCVNDGIYSTFEKAVWTLKYVDGYDYYIRCNISCYINIPLLDKVLISLDKNIVYCNAINTYIWDEKYINDLYPRGDFMIFSNTIKNGILKESDKYINCDSNKKDRLLIPHVDDCMIGLCLIDYFGKHYYKHLQMLSYNYIPQPSLDNLTFSLESITSRVKTVPPGITYSGYSWDDNDYRKLDCEKMKILNDTISKEDYSKRNIPLFKMLTDSRQTLAVQLVPVNVKQLYDYIEKKRS